MCNTPNTINILSWNANGLRTRRNELLEYLNDNNIDMALINETKLKPWVQIGFPGYNILRNDRIGKNGGGTAIIARNDYKVHQLNSDSNIEHTTIITEMDDKVYAITAIYLPPNSQDPIDIAELLHKNHSNVIGGDFNAHNRRWGGKYDTKRGQNIWEQTIKNGATIIAPEGPTNFPTGKSGDIIDFFITKDLKKDTKIETDTNLLSDHAAIVLKIPRQGTKFKETVTKTKINWDLYKTELEKYQHNNQVAVEIQIDELTKAMTRARNKATYTINNKQNRNWLNYEQKEIVKLKQIAKQKFLKTRSRIDKQVLNETTKMVKEMLQKRNQEQLNETLLRTNESHLDFWRITRIFKKDKVMNEPLQSAKGWLFKNKQIAEEMSEYYEKLFDLETTEKENRKLKVSKTSKTHKTTNWTLNDLADIVNKLPKVKAPGYDEITNMDMKNIPENIAKIFLNILNICRRRGLYPKNWKHSIICPINKKNKDPTQPKNRRPISLLPTMGKILETLIKIEYTKYIESKEIIPKSQYGFKAKHSALMQAENLTQIVEEARRKRRQAIVTCLDMEKAYDKTWRRGLLHKIEKIETPEHLRAIIKDFLTDRTYQVKVKNELSQTRTAKEGLPQGSPLSPILYNTMAYDIPNKSINSKILQFADDIAIVTTNTSVEYVKNQVKKDTTKIIKWTEKWKMKINTKKTEIARLSGKHYMTPEIKIGQTKINISRRIKYLGINFDFNGTFNNHRTIRTKLAKITAAKLRTMTTNKNVHQKNKLTIVQRIVEPILTYGMQITTDRNQNMDKRMEGTIMKMIRSAITQPDEIIINTNEEIREQIKRIPIWTKAKEQREKLLKALEESRKQV